jgi:hypothetical protein
LLVGVGIFLLFVITLFGILYLRLHHLPEHIASRPQKVQYEIVGVLGLLAMLTHINAFWVAALLLALINIPDFTSPLSRMAGALERIAARRYRRPAIVIGSDRVKAGAVAALVEEKPDRLPSPVGRITGH